MRWNRLLFPTLILEINEGKVYIIRTNFKWWPFVFTFFFFSCFFCLIARKKCCQQFYKVFDFTFRSVCVLYNYCIFSGIYDGLIVWFIERKEEECLIHLKWCFTKAIVEMESERLLATDMKTTMTLSYLLINSTWILIFL